jgi:D-arginine dehydrogenase
MIYDFAIIGAGMAGASLAAELAPHARVLLLEAEDTPGYHATGRSAAFWEECYGAADTRVTRVFDGAWISPAARRALYRAGRGS